jgi:hypothetical protein
MSNMSFPIYDGGCAASTPIISNPLYWYISPADRNFSKCPSSSQILGTFAAVNLVVALFSVALGNRSITNKLSRGFFGGKSSSVAEGLHAQRMQIPPSCLYSWIFPVALQIIANSINAAIMKGTYHKGFSVAQVMYFLHCTAENHLDYGRCSHAIQ